MAGKHSFLCRRVQKIISVFDFTHRGLKKFKPVFSHNPRCFPLPFCKQAVQYRLKSGAGQGIGKVVAGAVAFLCSSDSDYMTGQTLARRSSHGARVTEKHR